MEADTRIKLIIIGLVLAAIVVGYFILSNRFRVGSGTVSPTPSPIVTIPSPSPLPTDVSLSSPLPNTVSGTTKGGVENLPKTGFPLPLATAATMSVMLIGWHLRKYQN